MLIEEMGDQHIVNTIRMLWRNANWDAFRGAMRMIRGPVPHGDGAVMAFDQELLEGFQPEEFLHEAYDDLTAEARKRKLNW